MALFPLGGDRNNSRRRIWMVALLVAIPVFLFAVLFTDRRYRPRSVQVFRPGSQDANSLPPSQKPADVAVVGLVFFGRRSRVDVLRCYLERNLVAHGGWLDEVQFFQNTDVVEDVEFLDELVQTSPHFTIVRPEDEGGDADLDGFANAWSHLQRGKLYVKIDDDLIWMADDAVAEVVSMKLAHPEYAVVSANIINSPLMGWVHYRTGALHPYLPEYPGNLERSPAPGHRGQADSANAPPHRQPWKYLEHAPWQGPDEWYFDKADDPPFDGHRWLRLPHDADMHRTPVTEIEYATWGTGLKYWPIAAQQHYSLLENILDDRLSLYKTGTVWLTDYDRLSINMIAVWADEVLDNVPIEGDDEEWLTVTLPQKVGKSVAVATHALASHLSFQKQSNGIDQTDLLSRYKNYADSKICNRPRH